MARTNDDIRTILARVFAKESARLKSWGTKTDEKAAMSFAGAVTEYVRALMCESRYREMKRIYKFIHKNGIEAGDRDLKKYIKERLNATKAMSAAIQNFAEEKESKREWKHKSEHKHHHRRHK